MTYLVCAINPDISYIFVPYPVLSQRMYCFVSRSDISAIQQRSTSLLILSTNIRRITFVYNLDGKWCIPKFNKIRRTS